MGKAKLIIFILLLGSLSFWFWTNYRGTAISNSFLADGSIGRYLSKGTFLTLKARFIAEEIMESHKKDLLTDSKQAFQEPIVKYHPYLLMEVKYTLPDEATKEGKLLWGLVDGEMVIDTATWETTHGFRDAFASNADPHDFAIINALAANKGKMSRSALLNKLQLKEEELESWLRNAEKKHLITQKGSDCQLHFQNPKILAVPETKIDQILVAKPYSQTIHTPPKFSIREIERGTEAAFGKNFTILRKTEVFLPIYSIEVLNPDGSILTTDWNALTGQQVPPSYF
jgi:hypothetical protein